MVWNIDGNGGHLGRSRSRFPAFPLEDRGDAEGEGERERESERSGGRGRMKRRGACFVGGRGFVDNEMILEIGPRGASCPRDRASYQRRRRSRGVIVASLASVRTRWKLFFSLNIFFFFEEEEEEEEEFKLTNVQEERFNKYKIRKMINYCVMSLLLLTNYAPFFFFFLIEELN